uniref:G_PROTEIN_RECEP_F1_2 domain-containing protein n=1 Tax=Ascaris lumbricoides TaxID=6252 RepID=A0A0M3IXG5_ASCLU
MQVHIGDALNIEPITESNNGQLYLAMCVYSDTQFYTITADLISILVALNSLLRLVVYFLCNPQFRIRLIKLLLSSRQLGNMQVRTGTIFHTSLPD